MKTTFAKLRCIGAGSILLLAAGTEASRFAKPPEAKDVVGVYLGYSNYDDFYRLDLRADFTGYLAEVSLPQNITHEQGVLTYRVTKWDLKGFDLSFKLSSPEVKGYDFDFKGNAGAFGVLRLKLVGTGTNSHWERKLVLYPEGQNRVVAEETKEAIERAEAK